MVPTLTSIYRGKEYLPIQEICATCRGRPARARRSRNNSSVTQTGEYFRGGARAIGTFSEKHWAVTFVAARQLSDHPITISGWDGKVYFNTKRM
jgi:hypothetical protein